MNPANPTGSLQREDTDDSLRKERDKSDLEVRRRTARAADVADAVIEQARGDADAVLRTAREAEDRPRTSPPLAQDRQDEDALIQQQREEADAKLAEERRERNRALAALFALERELTDQHLQAERRGADLAVTSRDDFLGIVAHDLRGFMAEVVYRASSLARTAGDDPAAVRARELGRGIQRSTAAMNRLVGDLLDIAALEAGKLHVEISRGDLGGVLADAAEPFRAAAGAKGLALEIRARAEGAVPCLFDQDRVIQVLGNLVGNAIKFTPRGGRISLGLSLAGREAVLSVTDTGTGIPPDRLEAIFERFTQLAPSDRRGVGLGLYIAKCLIVAQRGRIWATSAPGAGSCFSFSLPRA